MSELPARELVPGDVVELHVGDRVPADIRVVKLKTATLRAEQASLTGESVAVLKSVEAIAEEACEIQAKVGMPSLVTNAGPPLFYPFFMSTYIWCLQSGEAQECCMD